MEANSWRLERNEMNGKELSTRFSFEIMTKMEMMNWK